MNPNDMEMVLREIARGERPFTDFFLQYDDLHGLWGGIRIRVSGAGRYELLRQERGAPEASVESGAVPAADIRALVRLLIELEAWQQLTPDRAPLPDESRAKLTVQVGDTAVTIWEWYNELAGNGRIVRIRDRLLAASSQTPGAPTQF